ncbi:hypothetical protein HYALB_00003708 [Hymenoscyphus albidus]|uniref:Uncharacterized protein n=1 Tax=Hymenoscyphus albidus TaxID=595503 RepID=A0A9N9LIS9_9HELO|nr:hypothetical protein HYALB_00003708 [Hymenoscyphus albidus]
MDSTSTSHQFDFRLTHAAVSATSDHDEDEDDGPASASATGNPVHAHDQPVSDHLECSLALPPAGLATRRDACPAPEVMVMTDIPSGSLCTLRYLLPTKVPPVPLPCACPARDEEAFRGI